MSFWSWLNTEPTDSELNHQDDIDAEQTRIYQEQLATIQKGREDAARRLQEVQADDKPSS